MAKINFKSSEAEPLGNPEPLPKGWYVLTIIESEMVPPKPGKEDNGDIFNITLLVDENEHPEYANRRVWVRMPIYAANETARRIARSTLSSITRAIGLDEVEDTEQLLGQRLRVKLGIEIDKEGIYDPKNRIQGAAPLEAQPQEATAKPAKPATAAVAKPSATTQPVKPSWKR